MKLHLPLLCAASLLLGVAPARANAATQRLLLSIGNNVGEPDDEVLSFADDDALRIRQLFVELGGVRSDRATVILDRDAAEVRRRLAEVSGRIAELRAGGEDAMLIVYVSAHAKAGILHLGGTKLPLAELRDAARASGARLSVLIVDACESGTLAKRKGGRAAPAYAVQLEQLPVEGQVVISSSGPAESSEEWESLKGSLFTHHLLTGLRGDADLEGDGKVSLAEVYAYAYRRTVVGAAAGQHPSYAWDLTGTGELLLTEPRTAGSALVFPAPAEGRYLVASQPRPDVVAEVEKVAGRPLRLAFPPGRYLLRKKAGASTGLLEVDLPYGGERTVREQEFAWRRYTEVALKGGYVELKTQAVLGLARVENEPIGGTGPRLTGAVGYRRTMGPWWAAGTFGFTRAQYRGIALDIREETLTGAVSGGYRWLTWALVPHVGLGVELIGVQQRVTRDQEEQISDTYGAPPLAPRRTLGVAAGPVVALEIPLPGQAFALVQGQWMLRHLPTVQGGLRDFRSVTQLSAGGGWRF